MKDGLLEMKEVIKKKFETTKQTLMEKFKKDIEITALPQEYIETEEKIDNMKNIFDNMLKTHKQMLKSDNYDQPIHDHVVGAMEKINEKLNMSSRGSSLSHAEPYSPHPPGVDNSKNRLIQQVISHVAINGSNLIDGEDYDENLYNYGSTMEKIGEARKKFNDDLEKTFLVPLKAFFEIQFSHSCSLRKDVTSARVELDVLKNKCSHVKNNETKLALLRKEQDEAEQKLNSLIEASKSRMNSILESDIMSKSIKNLVDVMKDYYRKVNEELENTEVCEKPKKNTETEGLDPDTNKNKASARKE